MKIYFQKKLPMTRSPEVIGTAELQNSNRLVEGYFDFEQHPVEHLIPLWSNSPFYRQGNTGSVQAGL